MSRRKFLLDEEGSEPSSLFLFEDSSYQVNSDTLDEAYLQPDLIVGSGSPENVALVKWAAVVSYRGTSYRGFARQTGLPTVGGYLEECLSHAHRYPTKLTCSGRTDAGVHAISQVISYLAPLDAKADTVLRSVNRQLPKDISVAWLDKVSPTFDARRSAKYRQYVYRISRSGLSSALLSESAWKVDSPLNVSAMRNAAYALIGEHDFYTFCKSSRGLNKPTTRRVFDVSLEETGSMVEIAIWANSFCQQMVRCLVGLLVEIGCGTRKGSEVREMLTAKDRGLIRLIAPPYGLYLYAVGFQPFDTKVVGEWSRSGFEPFSCVPDSLLKLRAS